MIFWLVSRMRLHTFNQLDEQLKTTNKSLYACCKISPLPSHLVIMAQVDIAWARTYQSVILPASKNQNSPVYYRSISSPSPFCFFSFLLTLVPYKQVLPLVFPWWFPLPTLAPRISQTQIQEQAEILGVYAKAFQHCWLRYLLILFTRG